MTNAQRAAIDGIRAVSRVLTPNRGIPKLYDLAVTAYVQSLTDGDLLAVAFALRETCDRIIVNAIREREGNDGEATTPIR